MKKISLKIETIQIKSRNKKLKSGIKFEVGHLVKWVDSDAIRELEQFLKRKTLEDTNNALRC